MRMRSIILTLAALAVAGAAQQQQPAPAADQKKAHLEGRVVSAVGEPLSKASVRLQPGNVVMIAPPGGGRPPSPPGSYSATTDGEGNFTLDDVDAGRYTLLAERTGFVTQRYGSSNPNAPGTPLTINDGDKLTGLTIEMLPQAVIAGQITDRDGDPLQGIQVRASRQVYTGGRRQLRDEGNAVTDDQGNFRIANLAPGRYYVLATTRAIGGPPGIGAISEAQETASVDTYFPNSVDQRGASPIELAAGDQRLGTNFQMRREKVYTVRGVAVDLTTNKPAAGATIVVVPPDAEVGPGAVSNSARVAPDGTFEIHNLTSGTHTLRGIAGGTLRMSTGNMMMVTRLSPAAPGAQGEESNATGSIEVTIGSADINEVGLQLTAGGQIDGRVQVEGGSFADLQADAPRQPPPPAGLPPLPNPGSFGVTLLPTAGISINGPSTRTNPDGTFAITGVSPDKYYVTVRMPPNSGYFVRSMRFGSQDITRAPLDAAAGGGTLDIVLVKGAAELTGTVANSNGEAMTGVTVSLWPKQPDLSSAGGGVQVATTDQNGSFRFQRLRPGDYYAVAWEELPDPGLGQYPEFLNRFTSKATPVTLGDDAQESIQAKLVERDAIQAEVAKLP